jgi:hypothetical protein
MDHPRRERIRELIQTLGSVRDQVHDIWIEEEGAFERRSAPSKETVSGGRSSDAFYNLEEATIRYKPPSSTCKAPSVTTRTNKPTPASHQRVVASRPDEGEVHEEG